VSLLGQQGRGTISGVVTDSSGAAVPSVSINIVNTATNASFPTVANEIGIYTAPALPVGSYTLTAEKQGFKKAVRSGVTLQVDQHAEVDFHLEVGATAESIEVVGEAPLVDSASATVGKVVENRRINDLPLNGRNVLALVLLTPGVKSQGGPTNSGFADRGIQLSSVSINGGPSALNSLVVDGGNNNNAYLADLNVNPTVDAIEEFKVQSNVMSSEFGFTAGGVINMVTKSGTNSPHGTLYEFFRNDAMDARRAFTVSKEPFRYNQFGGSIGAPIYIPKIYNGKNRSFFFFNYEEWRYSHFQSNILTVPTEIQRRGDFSQLRDVNGNPFLIYDPNTTKANPNGAGFVRDLFPGNIVPTSRMDPVSLNMLQFYPTPNRTPSNAFTQNNNWIGQVSEIRNMRQWSTKGDHRFGDKNGLSVRYSYYKHFNDNGYFSAYPDPNMRNRLDNYINRNAVITDTHTFTPTILNEFRSSIARQYFPFQAYSYGRDWPQKLGLPASVPGYTLPRVSIGGLPDPGAFSVGLRGNQTWQFFDMVTVIRGGHSIKAGIDHRLQRANNYQREVPSGSFGFPGGLTGNPQNQTGTGNGFAQFLLGSVSSATFTAYGGESEHAYSTSLFVQDDWKITHRLNVNLGVRWDYQQWPVERHNGLSNFDPFATNPDNGLLGRIEYASLDYGRSVYEPVYTNFSPRIGFAYDLTGNGKTVVRGGYAIFYPTTFYRDFFGNTAGFANTSTSYNPPGGNSNLAAFQFKDGLPSPYIQPLGPKLGPSAFLGQGVSWDQSSDNKVPMSQQWNLSLQKQLAGGVMIDAAYTANKADHLIAGGYGFNQLNPQYLSLGLALQDQVPNPYAGKVSGSLGGATISRQQFLLPYPYYSSIAVRNPHLGSSIYHAFLLSVEKRMSKGIVILASYTNAKLISNSIVTPINFGPVEQVGVVGYQNGKFDRAAERSLDPTDVSQRLVLSGVFELPFGQGKHWSAQSKAVNKIIGGWQLNTIGTIQTGNPVVVTGASNFLATRPNSTGKSPKLDTRTPERWFDTTQFVNPPNYTFGNLGRVLADVRNPGTVNFDLSMIKDTTIVERVRMQFRFEMFNFANHTNLGNVSAGFSPGADGLNRSATFGTITSARDPRILQLGLKLIF
jgi:outer membrane receptor protein involved in Fe transport